MQDSTEISLYDIVQFLVDNVKLFFLSMLVCGLVGLCATWLQPQYTASSSVYYSSKETDASLKHFDLVTWRTIQHKLALLSQELSTNAVPEQGLLLSMSSPSWWSSHVSPVKALTLDESKELLGINSMIVGPNKPSDESDTVRFLGRAIKESTRISSISLSITATTADQALKDVTYSAKFIQQGLGILAYRDLILAMSEKLQQSEDQIAISLDQANLELIALQKRRDNLMLLQREFPVEKTAIHTVDVTEATTKYLPLANQLIAINIDINDLNVRIFSLKQNKIQNKLIADFINKATQIVRQTIPFTDVGDQLLSIVSTLRMQYGADDVANNLTLNIISQQLKQTQLDLHSRVTLGTTSLTKQPDYLKSTIKSAFLGLAIGFILSLLSLLVRISLKRKTSRN